MVVREGNIGDAHDVVVVAAFHVFKQIVTLDDNCCKIDGVSATMRTLQVKHSNTVGVARIFL